MKTVGETAYNSALFNFSAYNLTKCKKPGSFESSKTIDFQKDAAFDDINWADCIKKHNALVDEIKTKKELLKK